MWLELEELIDLLSRLLLGWIVMSQYLLCIQAKLQAYLSPLAGSFVFFFYYFNKNKLRPLDQSLPIVFYTWMGEIRATIERNMIQNLVWFLLGGHLNRIQYIISSSYNLLGVLSWTERTRLFMVDKPGPKIDPCCSLVTCRNPNWAPQALALWMRWASAATDHIKHSIISYQETSNSIRRRFPKKDCAYWWGSKL